MDTGQYTYISFPIRVLKNFLPFTVLCYYLTNFVSSIIKLIYFSGLTNFVIKNNVNSCYFIYLLLIFYFYRFSFGVVSNQISPCCTNYFHDILVGYSSLVIRQLQMYRRILDTRYVLFSWLWFWWEQGEVIEWVFYGFIFAQW